MLGKLRNIAIKTLLIFLGLNIILIFISFFVKLDKERYSNNVFPSDNLLLNYDDTRDYIKLDIDNALVTSNKESSDIYLYDNDYKDNVISWDEEIIEFKVIIPDSKEYEIALDYCSRQDGVEDITINVIINNEIFDEYNNLILPTYWTDDGNGEVYDIYHNQVVPSQKRYNVWKKSFLFDQRFFLENPLHFKLNEGENTIKIIKNKGKLLLGDLYIFSCDKTKIENNSDYSVNQLITIEGENPLCKSSTEIIPTSVSKPHLSPYSTSKNMLNNMSGDSFNQSGDSLTYCFNIEEEGLYNISLKYYISQTYTNVYSKIYIDNIILNDKLNRYCFEAKKDFSNETLSDGEDAIEIYFTKGTHTLTIQQDASLQAPIYYELTKMLEEINELYLEVIKITGGNIDKNKNWDIDKFIPTARTKLNDWKTRLESLLDLIKEVSVVKGEKQNRLYQQINNAYNKICVLVSNPNKLPHKLALLSVGSSSASELLSTSLHTSTFSPLSIDKIYIHSKDVKVPKVKKNIFTNYFAVMQKIFRSNVEKSEKDVVRIWVNRSTYYVSLMQQFADAYYTPNSNIKVVLSLLPDESKITYANASNTQPDAAIGVSSTIPYDLGLRGALANLKEMPGFGELFSEYATGAITNMIEGNNVYGLPETQDFQVLFYREDILNKFNIKVPNTYEELINILPTLQRYGMNFYMPMAGGSGLKSISITAPFIYQYGGDIYSADYMQTAIDSNKAIEAINTMVELFSIYSLPLTTQNFYESFKNSTVPLGISGFDSYLKFLNVAPEIEGKWNITLSLGVEENGVINRTNTGDTKAAVIFKKSKNQDKAWDFLKWWLSSDIQTRFSNSIQTTYGPNFLWNTANVVAFKNLAIPEEHKTVILKQWEYLYQVPYTPATYMVERGISNVWNTAVFDQASIRSSITDYTIEINKEIKRKMIEFGYLDKNGNKVKEYIIPSIREIESWKRG